MRQSGRGHCFCFFIFFLACLVQESLYSDNEWHNDWLPIRSLTCCHTIVSFYFECGHTTCPNAVFRSLDLSAVCYEIAVLTDCNWPTGGRGADGRARLAGGRAQGKDRLVPRQLRREDSGIRGPAEPARHGGPIRPRA